MKIYDVVEKRYLHFNNSEDTQYHYETCSLTDAKEFVLKYINKKRNYYIEHGAEWVKDKYANTWRCGPFSIYIQVRVIPGLDKMHLDNNKNIEDQEIIKFAVSVLQGDGIAKDMVREILKI
jgi:hypothetical protein